ncbi:MAG: PLD nuclease N-terminal domain-containing protein [Microbacteriaceae bacterium]
MARLLLILPVVVLGFMIYAIADLVLIDERRVRALPKWGWAVLIVLLPLIGALLWLVLGRERLTSGQPSRRAPSAPDDDPDFLAKLGKDADQDERIRRLEEQLSLLDDDQDDAGEAGKPGKR